MASGSDPGSLSTIPEINSSEELSHHFLANGTPHHNAHAPAMVGPAPQDFRDNELQLIFEVVQRAEQLLPSAGTAVTALYAAHSEICNKQGLKTDVDQRKATLFFKLGSRTYAETLRGSFEEWLRRMNCTIRFDDNGDSTNDSASDTNDDDFSSSRSDHPDLAYDADGATESDDDDDTSDRLDVDGETDAEEGDEAPDDANPPGAQKRHVARPDAPVGAESFLERSAIAFENHRTKFAAVSNIQQWQARSSGLQMQLEMFHGAREADFIDTAEDRFLYWKDAAAELEEAPVSHIPSNVYSKRIETIACRTYEILTSKKILAQWRRQCAKHPLEPLPEPPPEQPKEEVAGDLYLSKLAVRAHETLMKSRVFTRWSNRASEEEDKARVALRAHEMGLKSKAFGVRPRLEVLALALQQRILSNDGSASPIELPERPASAPVESTASPLGSPLPLPAQLAKSDEDLTRAVDVVQDEPEEEDERTMLARRHIMRMRFFRAWSEYTQTHTDKVRGHVMQATFDSWRGTSDALDIRVSSHAHQQEQNNTKMTLQKWIAAASESADLNTRAEGMEKRARVEGALKPWLAQARAGRRLEAKKEGGFWQWYNTPFRDVAFDRAASLYREDRKKREAISQWRLVAEEARRRGDMRQDWASKADYYRAATTTLRAWKAQAREHAVHVSMKRDAFDAWRQLSAGNLPQQQQMQSFAERADFFYKMTEMLPAWQAVADENSNKQQQLEEYSERANFYYRTRDTVLVWRTLAKKRRKARFKEAHLEVRRRVKRGMGEYCIAQWRDKLQTSFDRYEYMNVALEDAVAGREYVTTAETFDTWRRRAQEKTQLGLMSNDTIKQRAIDTWRERHLAIQAMQFEAGQYRKNRSTGKALRVWNLNSLQISSRRHTVDNIREKSGRRLLRQRFEAWHGSAAAKNVSTQLHQGDADIVEDGQQQAARLQSKSLLFSSWRATATREPPPRFQDLREEDVADVAEDELSLEPAPEVEAGTPYAPTPGRPQLLLGSFGRQQTTTPLAPVPSRQAAWQARDSVLGGSAIDLRANRAGARSRRNLRVSWAQ